MQINCPNCQSSVEVDESDPGEVMCSNCGSTFTNVSVDFNPKFVSALPPLQERTRALAFEQQRLGKLELLERIGAGAFGVVWKARDTELDRHVAVKIPHPGQITDDQEADRFLREGRSAARLRHPGIVSVYDVGRIDDLPYLACEFVDGVTLGDLLTARRPAFRETARLVAEVADALDYAHSMGVVHRDIKPSNIMLEQGERTEGGAGSSPGVTLGRPMLTDFGLALVDEGEAASNSDGQVLGTPAYMSPEQAAGKGNNVDARSDVYSLGVVLYQLLAGELPFRGNLRMLLQQVLREEPNPPRRLNDKIPRDLETITLKCLAKEPEKRYASAALLAADLRRWLAGEPVQARPVSRPERWWRWAKRNPGVAGLSAAVLLLLLTVAVGSTVAAVRIAAARDDADRNAAAAKRIATDERQARDTADKALAAEQQQRKQAEINLARALGAENEAETAEAEAQQVALFMVGLFRGSDPLSFGGYEFGAPSELGQDLTAREMLDRGAKKIAGQLDDQPLVQAALLDTIGDVYTSLGEIETGVPFLERALEIRRAATDGPHPDLADSLHNVGFMRFIQGRYGESEVLFREAIAMRTAMLGPEAPETLLSKFMFAMVLLETDVTAEIEQLLTDVVGARSKQLVGNERDVAFAYTGLALVFAHQGDTAKALQAVQQAIAVLNTDQGPDPVVEVFAIAVQGMLQSQLGNVDGAAKQFSRSLEKAYELVGRGHPAVTFLQMELGVFLQNAGDHAGAEKIFRDALAQSLRIYGRQPRTAETMVELANLARNAGQLAEAERLYLGAVEIQRTILSPDHPYLAYSLARLGSLRIGQGDFKDALNRFNQSLQILTKQMGDDSYQLVLPLCGLGAASVALGRDADAKQYFKRARQLADVQLAGGKIVRRMQIDVGELASLGKILVEHDHFAAGQQVLGLTLEILKMSERGNDWRVAEVESALGAALTADKNFKAAEPLLTRSQKNLKAKFGADDPRTQTALSRLVVLYDASQQSDKADRLRKDLAQPSSE